MDISLLNSVIIWEFGQLAWGNAEVSLSFLSLFFFLVSLFLLLAKNRKRQFVHNPEGQRHTN